MIYLDNAATTKPFDGVLALATRVFTQEYYNPSALYEPAFAVKKQVEAARKALCAMLGGGGKLYFTGSATESNAWALCSGNKNKRGNVVISAGEHASVYETAVSQNRSEVRIVGLAADGRVDVEDFARKVDQNTSLVSILHCSNETGAVNDIRALVKIAKEKNPDVVFHSDGVQAFCKIPVSLPSLGVDLYSISAHKVGGFKGVGALWVKDGLHIAPLLYGGGQEQGMRSGTENTAGILAFSEAARLFAQVDKQKIADLRLSIRENLKTVDGIVFNEAEGGSPFILSFSVPHLKAEILQRLLCARGILVGLGSACASAKRHNRVLEAMGRNALLTQGTVRLSFGAQNGTDDGAGIAQVIKDCIQKAKA